jgi:hypothetical protein
VLENLAERFLKEVQIAEARCFVAGSLVSMADGTTKPIEAVAVGDRVLGWSAERKKLVPARVTHLKPKDTVVKPTVVVTLEDGRSVRCTPDHRFLVQDGSYVEAKDLIASRQRVAVSCDFAKSPAIVPEDAPWMILLDECGTLDVGDGLPKAMAFARLCGLLLTDGNVHLSTTRTAKGRIVMSCTVGTDVGKTLVLNDIELLCGIRPGTGENVYQAVFPSVLARAIFATDPVAFEPGPRIGKPFQLPSWITRPGCPKVILCEFLGGMFGGDGHAPILGGESGKLRVTPVQFSRSKRGPQADSLRAGMDRIVAMMGSLGVQAHVARTFTIKKNTVVKLTVDGGSGTVAFADNIGFRYDPHKMVRLAVAAAYFRRRDACFAFYEDVRVTATAWRNESGATWKTSRAKALKEVSAHRVQVSTDKHCVPSIGVFFQQKEARTSANGHAMGPASERAQWIDSVGARSLMRGPEIATQTASATKTNETRTQDSLETKEEKKADRGGDVDGAGKPAHVVKSPSYAVKTKDLGLPSFFLKVVAVTAAQPAVVFDISVEDPINSFVVAGCIVSNCFYAFQMGSEMVHSEMYSLLIDTYVKVRVSALTCSSL